MTPDFRKARQLLGLGITEFAALHKVAPQTIRRWEMPETAISHRKPGGSAIALTEHLLSQHTKEQGNG